jgi:hypothetical protein
MSSIISRKVAGSRLDEVDLFNLPNPSSRIVALRSIEPLTEISTGDIFGGMAAGAYGRQNSQPFMSRFSKENVGASTSHNPMALHCALQRQPWLS